MKRSLPFLLLGLVGLLLYGHTLHVPFYLDDFANIAQSPVVKDLGLAFKGVFARRGLSNLTFAVNYRLAGHDLASYHLLNIVIHLAAASVVLLLLRRVFPGRAWLALCGALVFLAHPLQTEGVTYLVQRMTSLSAFFFLLALYYFVRGREYLATHGVFRDRQHLTWYVAALVAGGLSILAKENAVVLPLALLLFVRLFLPDADRRWRPLLIYTAPFLVLPLLATIIYLLLPLASGAGVKPSGISALLRNMEGNSPLHYLVTQFSVLWIYIRMLFLPYGQALDHAYPVSKELLTLKSVAGLTGLLGLFVLAWRLLPRQPAIAGGILWFFLTLAIESSLIPLDPLFEHRLYLPMFGFAMLVPALLPLLPRPGLRVGAAVAFLLVLAVLTWQRNALWNDPFAFNKNDLQIAPENERVMINLGELYRAHGSVVEAERLYLRSLALNPRMVVGYLGVREIYLAQKRDDELIDILSKAITQFPDNILLYNELAFVYGKKGDITNATVVLKRAVEVNPADPAAANSYYNLAQMSIFPGDAEQVEIYLRKALSLNNNHAEARGMLNDLLKKQGRAEEGSQKGMQRGE
jgi:protein O-mannosyl-transferase